MSPAAVRLVGVSKAFAGVPVLVDVDLEVAAGKTLALLGESGAGKTTLLRIVAGLDDPDAGTVEIDGRIVADPESVVPAERRETGMVFQGLELWPHMTAAENVAFGLPGRPRGRAALESPRVLELADAVGLSIGILERKPSTISGGERQRVAIARALAPDPRVLLYDEPLANLDPGRRAEIRRLVRRLAARSSTTVLYVTHDAAEALEMGDEVAVLAAGRLVDRGLPEEVYRRPRSVEGARALGAVSLLPARVRPGGGGAATVETALGTFEVAAASASSLAALRPEQVRPAGEGPEAVIVDSYPRGPDWAFTARLASGDVAVEGRSSARLEPGTTVRLGVVGGPVLLPTRAAPTQADIGVDR